MDAGRIIRSVVLGLGLGSAGCDEHAAERNRLGRERDFWARERQHLVVHQANLQIAIHRELNGRPVEALSYEERLRVFPLGVRLEETGRQIRVVTGRIEQLQYDIGTVDQPYP